MYLWQGPLIYFEDSNIILQVWLLSARVDHIVRVSDNLLDGEGDVVCLPTGGGTVAAITVPLSTQNVNIISSHLPDFGICATPTDIEGS